jgi:glutaredoxin
VITRLIALVAFVAASALLAVVLRRRDGRTRSVDTAARFTPEDLAVPLGGTATFVQFSSSTCAPCRVVRRLLGELTANRPDLVHVELDADHHLDLLRQHRVLTTPTVFVLDCRGRVRQRLSGTPDRHVLQNLAAHLPAPSPASPSAPGDPTSSRSKVSHG